MPSPQPATGSWGPRTYATLCAPSFLALSPRHQSRASKIPRQVTQSNRSNSRCLSRTHPKASVLESGASQEHVRTSLGGALPLQLQRTPLLSSRHAAAQPERLKLNTVRARLSSWNPLKQQQNRHNCACARSRNQTYARFAPRNSLALLVTSQSATI